MISCRHRLCGHGGTPSMKVSRDGWISARSAIRWCASTLGKQMSRVWAAAGANEDNFGITVISKTPEERKSTENVGSHSDLASSASASARVGRYSWASAKATEQLKNPFAVLLNATRTWT